MKLFFHYGKSLWNKRDNVQNVAGHYRNSPLKGEFRDNDVVGAATSEEAGLKPKPVGAFSSSPTPLTPGLKWSSTWKRSSDEMSCGEGEGPAGRQIGESSYTHVVSPPEGIFHAVDIFEGLT